MKWKAIEHKARGVKCDKPGCGWRDDTVTEDMYPSLLNTFCPDCGSRLITHKDLETLKKAHRVILIINLVCIPFVIWRGLWNFVTRTKYSTGTLVRIHKPVGEDKYTVASVGTYDAEKKEAV
jgi:hypothetical protein